MKKNKALHSKTNWIEWAAFGDPRHSQAAKENQNKEPGAHKQKSTSGVIGRAALIQENIEYRKSPNAPLNITGHSHYNASERRNRAKRRMK